MCLSLPWFYGPGHDTRSCAGACASGCADDACADGEDESSRMHDGGSFCALMSCGLRFVCWCMVALCWWTLLCYEVGWLMYAAGWLLYYDGRLMDDGALILDSS